MTQPTEEPILSRLVLGSRTKDLVHRDLTPSSRLIGEEGGGDGATEDPECDSKGAEGQEDLEHGEEEEDCVDGNSRRLPPLERLLVSRWRPHFLHYSVKKNAIIITLF